MTSSGVRPANPKYSQYKSYRIHGVPPRNTCERTGWRMSGGCSQQGELGVSVFAVRVCTQPGTGGGYHEGQKTSHRPRLLNPQSRLLLPANRKLLPVVDGVR